MAKVLLFTNFGGLIPKVIFEKIDKKLSFIQSRMDANLISFIEENVVAELDESVHTYDWFTSNPDVILYSKKKDNLKYFVYCSEHRHIICFSIIDVDTNNRWTIKEYDGYESIYYLDSSWVCVDEKENYWSRVLQ